MLHGILRFALKFIHCLTLFKDLFKKRNPPVSLHRLKKCRSTRKQSGIIFPSVLPIRLSGQVPLIVQSRPLIISLIRPPATRTTLPSPRGAIHPRVKLVHHIRLVRPGGTRRSGARSRSSSSSRATDSGRVVSHSRSVGCPRADVPVAVGIDTWVQCVGEP